MTQTDLSPLLTMKEAISYLKISRSTLYRLMWSGQLTGHKVGNSWRYYVDDLRALVAGDELLNSTPDIKDVAHQQI